MKKKNYLKVAIDSPAGSGAGTQAKLISEHYKLYYLDTGKLYRILGKVFLKNDSKINYSLFRKIIKKTKPVNLKSKKLLINEIGMAAARLAKIKKIRKIVNDYQIGISKFPPKNYNGVCLDGRDITYNIMPDAQIKIFMIASLSVRAKRRFKELSNLDHKITFNEVLKSIKERDFSDYNRKISPLKKTKDSIVINNSNLTIKECFLKLKKIIDKEIKFNFS